MRKGFMMNKLATLLFVLVAVVSFARPASAQGGAIPQPSGPVAFCGTQAAPIADSYQFIFDGGAPEAVTMTTPGDPAGNPLRTFCDANAPGWTHSFSIPAARFVVGTHTVIVRAINAFGSTNGPSFAVTVGIAPGPFTINGVGVPPAE